MQNTLTFAKHIWDTVEILVPPCCISKQGNLYKQICTTQVMLVRVVMQPITFLLKISNFSAQLYFFNFSKTFEPVLMDKSSSNLNALEGWYSKIFYKKNHSITILSLEYSGKILGTLFWAIGLLIAGFRVVMQSITFLLKISNFSAQLYFFNFSNTFEPVLIHYNAL